MKYLFNILFWSVISAAFIGPGTVTTAASAGAGFGFSLLWALSFSTVACLVLQEASARVTIVSGRNLGQAIRSQFTGAILSILVLLLVLGAIVLGCAAYEAGNILGGVAGAALITELSPTLLNVASSILAAALLWLGTTQTVAKLLGLVVAFMGVAFAVCAVLLRPSAPAILAGALLPAFPTGSGLLILGLIGTTVVPYNLFLGSGIAAGAKVNDMRLGLGVAVILGGLISMAILVVGSTVTASFSYEAVASTLRIRLGNWSAPMFGFGLFAAGFSSAITAPLAAAITVRSLQSSEMSTRWLENSWRYRSVWLGVLLVGVGFGLSNIKPIPAIILAQALNGVLLPLVAIFLLIVVNDLALMGESGINGALSNVFLSIVVVVSVVLGVTNVLRAIAAAVQLSAPNEPTLFAISAIITIAVTVPLVPVIRRRRRGTSAVQSENIP